MATVNRNKSYYCRTASKYDLVENDFSKIGGLNHHIKLLRELIVTPLLYGDLFKHFNIKAPRGVLFFGPPGTVINFLSFLISPNNFFLIKELAKL